MANRSNSIDVPDFTCGAWRSNKPVDPNLPWGGSTGVIRLDSSAEQMELSASPCPEAEYNA